MIKRFKIILAACMLSTFMLLTCNIRSIIATSINLESPSWVTPINAVASDYDVVSGRWYTGPAYLAIDGISYTGWTLRGMGTIKFDMGQKCLIQGIDTYRNGTVTNGNAVNIYVNDQLVLSEEQFSTASNRRYFAPVIGQTITYETLSIPHNYLGQIATWSELSEFKAFISPVPVRVMPWIPLLLFDD